MLMLIMMGTRGSVGWEAQVLTVLDYQSPREVSLYRSCWAASEL